MNTIKLLRSIGYPNDGVLEPIELVEDQELYKLARKNKIGSLYLRVLDQHGELNELEAEWAERSKYQSDLKTTYANLAETITQFDGIVVKSDFPFWADSSDVDIVVYDEKISNLEIIFKAKGYKISGVAPTALSVRDPDTRQLVDVQSDFGLHNVLYFDKETIDVERRQIKDHELPVASRGSDLALHVNHSITELMFTLKEFYTTLFFLESFDDTEYETFVEKTLQNRSHNGCRAFFTAVRELSEAAFSKSPNRLDDIDAKWGRSRAEARKLSKTDYVTPYKYAPSSFLRYTLGKCRQRVFLKSLLRQLPHFANPATAYYITSKVFSRVRREDYVNTEN